MKIPGFKFLFVICLAVVALLVSSIVGLFEMIVEQNEMGRKINKYDKEMNEKVFLKEAYHVS